MAGDCWLGEADVRNDLADAAFACPEEQDDLQSGRVAECAEQIGFEVHVVLD